MEDSFTRRTLLYLDAKDYSKRDDPRQNALQHDLVGIFKASACQPGLQGDKWPVQSAGDSVFCVLPESVAEAAVIDTFIGELAKQLATLNDGRGAADALRLRCAVHQGLVRRSGNGYAGAAAVVPVRLAESKPSRAVLSSLTDVNLVLAISATVYNEVVAQGHTQVPPAAFREVLLDESGYRTAAWLHVPGRDLRGLDLKESVETPPAIENAESHRVAEVVNFISQMTTNTAVFGIHKTNS